MRNIVIGFVFGTIAGVAWIANELRKVEEVDEWEKS